ncbi:MAG: hypothetical protein GOV00_04275 [Candidatus Altiarchaeota archaeon]|nr:hypothetical protein [Candidatus Altiarchaeota archaeon]
MTRKRDRLQIIYDILHFLQGRKGKVRPTHILYKSNLSHQMLTSYLTELTSNGFVIEQTDKKGKKLYEITKKGQNFLRDFHVIRSFIDSYGLE